MSIINDALKKAQVSLKRTNKIPEKKQVAPDNQSTTNVYEKLYKAQQDKKNALNSGQDPIEKPSEKKTASLRSAKKWLKISSVTALYLLLISASFFFISRYQPVKDFLHSIKKSGTPSRSHISQKAPNKRKYKDGELILNGTSLIDGKRVALINDEIYEIGEMVNGKKIISINLNKIELRDAEKIITLRVH